MSIVLYIAVLNHGIVCCLYWQDEDLGRRELWERNLELITLHNLEASMGLHSYDLGMNHMGDMVRTSTQFLPFPLHFFFCGFCLHAHASGFA